MAKRRKKRQPRVREARLEDIGLFKMLWSEFMEVNQSKGSPVIASESNLEFYCGLFTLYLEEQFPGVVLFIGEDAVLIWGSAGDAHMETTVGHQAMGWGTYVRERARGKGLSTLIRNEAIAKLKEMNFDSIQGAYSVGDDEGEQTQKKVGFVDQTVITVLKLGE